MNNYHRICSPKYDSGSTIPVHDLRVCSVYRRDMLPPTRTSYYTSTSYEVGTTRKNAKNDSSYSCRTYRTFYEYLD
jgi:hypothetical protein